MRDAMRTHGERRLLSAVSKCDGGRRSSPVPLLGAAPVVLVLARRLDAPAAAVESLLLDGQPLNFA